MRTTHEIRNIKSHIRAAAFAGEEFISGYAARFDVLSEPIGTFRERIAPGAFTRALRAGQDVRCLVNHDATQILGRTKAGTLKLSVDNQGLAFRARLPDTQIARDLAVSVRRGDLTECSFGFLCVKDSWSQEPDPKIASQQITVRTVLDADLFDVSLVAYPAYGGTSAAMDARAATRTMVPHYAGTSQAELRSQILSVDDWCSEARLQLLFLEIEGN